MSRHRIELGAVGEALAADWYVANGYTILDRNWRCRAGELDLVLASGRTVVFCEVKTRTTTAYGTPAEAVTRTKQLRIRRLAAEWLSHSQLRPASLRFDVAAVLAGELEVIEAAF
ncbi:MAG: YraN family protein [Acidimicrobiia bacterium]|nr:YraN family protein [Acidimicrobiia bacterium]